MRFEPQSTDASPAVSRPARHDSGAAVLELLRGRVPMAVVELGTGTGERASGLLRHYRDADYIGFEPSPTLLAISRAALATFAERAAAEGRNLAIQLPLEKGSADLVLCLDILEFLRMDELYMAIAEARRTLRTGSLCVLRSLSFGAGLRGMLAAKARSWLPARYHGARPLELNHYVSPEDWRVISDVRIPEGWLSRQTLVLERLPEPEASE